MGTDRSNEPRITEALAQFASSLSFEQIPEQARTVARHCLMDMVGVTLAGKGEPLSEILRSELGSESGERRFELAVPELGPMTFEGTLMRVRWEVELRLDCAHH